MSGMDHTLTPSPPTDPGPDIPWDFPNRKPTVEEAEAILTLVRGGWLKLELTLDTP